MKLPVNDIIVKPGRRSVDQEAVERLSRSMAVSGLINPVTVDASHTLIAGQHRLEAAKLLGWYDIECHICEMDDLHAQLAEIDENLIRRDLSDLDLCEQFAKRKKIYELLHPETKARNTAGHVSNFPSSTDKLSSEVKSFSEDTADKLGVSARTIERQVRIAETLTPETKAILRESKANVTKQNMLKLSKLDPAQQADAAAQLADGTIRSVDEYTRAPASQDESQINYYRSGAFIVDTFSTSAAVLSNVREGHRTLLENYRRILTPTQIQKLKQLAADTAILLNDYAIFLEAEYDYCKNKETEVSE